LSYLIDTNVLSELRRREPDAGVVRWMSERPAATLYLSVLTLGELRKGVDGLPEGDRKRRLGDWLEVELPAWFAGRILPVNVAVAQRWGWLLARSGRPVPAMSATGIYRPLQSRHKPARARSAARSRSRHIPASA
jgi:toxin FitB